MQNVKIICSFILALILWSHFVLGDEIHPAYTVNIPMSDGTELPADIYLPTSTESTTQWSIILVRNPSGRKHFAQDFAQMTTWDYVVVLQDTRNVIDQEGKTMPYYHDGWADGYRDGYDTVEWLSKQKFSNGKIGTFGFSSSGITQLLMAPSAPPSLKSQYVGVAAASIYDHAIFIGGQFRKHQVENWLGYYAGHPSVLKNVVDQPFYNDFWQRLDSRKVASQVNVPAVHYGGWYDTFLLGTLESYMTRQELGAEGARGKQKLVIGPWTHFWPKVQSLGNFELPASARVPPMDISPKRWFDYSLKGIDNGIDNIPSVTYYVMGPLDGTPSGGNIWRSSNTWPIPANQTPFYLGSDGNLSPASFSNEVALTYIYDPLNPVPTLGGRNLFLDPGPQDQGSIESRADVLTFTTPILEEEIEVTGQIMAKLYFSSDRRDTDVSVRLCDVYPDGKSLLIADGICRVAAQSYKSIGFDIDHHLPREVEVDLWSTSIVFAKGHRIRVSVTSSNYPRFERNFNIGLASRHVGAPLRAKNTLHIGGKFDSRIIFPVVTKN